MRLAVTLWGHTKNSINGWVQPGENYLIYVSNRHFAHWERKMEKQVSDILTHLLQPVSHPVPLVCPPPEATICVAEATDATYQQELILPKCPTHSFISTYAQMVRFINLGLKVNEQTQKITLLSELVAKKKKKKQKKNRECRSLFILDGLRVIYH